MSDKKIGRREIFKKAIVGITTIGAMSSARSDNSCKVTAAQPEGPFYPIKDQLDKNRDLTSVKGKTKKAIGEVVILKGVVTGGNCKPVKGALVEIWQACETGKYNHPADPNQAELDPNFQYWGQAITDEKGEYAFKTIKPGAYQATANWKRPPHIHMKVQLRGFEEIITQIYFSEEVVLNKRDRILDSLKLDDRKNVIVNFKKTKENKKYRVGEFNISLKKF